ncbi:MAG TPA: protein kinase, partial [Pyrinomonadaceae bacterium]|nr:protein kinase [Pyrinomonadaceae bacterium]
MDSECWIKIKESFMTAIDLHGGDRLDFLDKCDLDVRREVERLLNANSNAGGFISELAITDFGFTLDEPTDNYIGKQIDSYLIEREIGQGGMGTVYLAKRADASYEKHVAIKLIKRGMDTNAVLKRFIMERQILAQLQHRNIASLLDGGTTPDGLPYFVMEYVDGLPVTKFCDAHQYSITERLVLFREICSAISYAHQNLVVHRDLKPSNIIVTIDGTSKLLDFGIAKLLHPEWSMDTNEATATMFRIMTPEYASPEQLRGLPITTASDVYSLGVILYELLSGHRPHKFGGRRSEEMVQVVLTEEPLKPSLAISRQSTTDETIQSDTNESKLDKLALKRPKLLKGDLDNIVLKALRKEPDRRYASVHELSEDILRHLDGRPVAATADSSIYRLRKFVRRHRGGVAAGGLVILTLMITTSVTLWQAYVAGRERDRAEQRFSQVRKLAHTVLFEYHDGIAELAGSTPIREKMVKDAIEYLDNLAAESSGDADLQRELVSAYQKVGDVQGNPYVGNLGNPDGAIESYRKGLAILEALPKTDAQTPESRFAFGRSYEKIGDILWAGGASADSEANYRHALEIYEQLRSTGELVDLPSINRIQNRIGQTREQVADYDGALESYDLSLKEARDLLDTDPANSKFRRPVAVAFAKIGDVYYEKHDYKMAASNFGSSFSMLQILSDGEPENMTLRRNLELIEARIALTQLQSGNIADAIRSNQQTITIQRQISAADPNNSQIWYDLAATLGNLGECFGKAGQFDLSEKSFQEAISLSKQSLAKDPTFSQGKAHFANNYLMYAEMLEKSGAPARALENYRNAQVIFESEPLKSESAEMLAELYEGVGDALLAINGSGKNLTDA